MILLGEAEAYYFETSRLCYSRDRPLSSNPRGFWRITGGGETFANPICHLPKEESEGPR